MNFNNNNNNGMMGRVVPIPGQSNVNTIGSMFPGNAATRPNQVNGQSLNNSIGSFPATLNTGLEKQWENIRLLAETFEKEISLANELGYRKYFTPQSIPQHLSTMSKTFMKSTGIDENPITAAITGLTGWDPKWNEVAISGSSIEITTNAYGRFYKKHRFSDDISKVDWYGELASKFKDNANRTLDNLAAIRMYEGSNKLFVESIAAFDPLTPLAPRITLAADASKVNTHLTWDAIKEAKFIMENHKEEYNIVNPATGALVKAYRHNPIAGYDGQNYLVVLSRNGYNQLMSDPQFRESYIVNGGYYAQAAAEETLGISSPMFHLKFEIVNNPLTISKQAEPIVSTEGQQALECCFVIGGNNGAQIAVELSWEGQTRMINIGYEDSPKVDPFALLSVIGWITVTDFAVIRNECIYCIPFQKNKLVIAGNPVASKNVLWKE